MKAFIEVLSGVVRVGEECDEYGKPYELAVAFSCDNCVATVKALTAPPGGLRRHHVEAVLEAFSKMGMTAHWERIKAAA